MSAAALEGGAASIEAGEAIEIFAWELPSRPVDYGKVMYDKVRINPHGTITGIEAA